MNLNKVFIIGNLTRDPDFRQTPNGQSVCTIGVATNKYIPTKEGKREEVEFHQIVVWGKQAEAVNQYLRKGSEVLVEGSIKTRTWDDQKGEKKFRTEIVAESIQFGAKRDKKQEDNLNDIPAEEIPW